MLKKVSILFILIFAISCASTKKIESDEDFSTDPSSDKNVLSLDEPSTSSSSATGKDEFAEFDSPPAQDTAAKSSASDDLGDLEKELENASATPAPVVPEPVASTPPPEEVKTEVPSPEVVVEKPVENEQKVEKEAPTPITAVKYTSNDAGGTLQIIAGKPLKFNTRKNAYTNQFIIEVENSTIANNLKRTLNTKDFASAIRSIDVYTKDEEKLTRFVVQMRPDTANPIAQIEGTNLLIIGGQNPEYIAQQKLKEIKPKVTPETEALKSAVDDVNIDLTTEGIFSEQTLSDFLASNNKFYGKKISIETNNIDVKEAIKFISEDSGVNVIFDDGIGGNVSLKLRQVPWDQALLLLLRSKKLGYKRQGNVLRIAKISDIQKEEDDAIKLADLRKSSEPLEVKRFFIGYADIKDLEAKIKDFINTTIVTQDGKTQAVSSTRGKVISDTRTSSLIVTDTPDNLVKIEKLILALDSQPQQVLIEGKVIEAREGFTESVGVIWSNDPSTSKTVNKSRLSINPGLGLNQGILSSSLTFGQLDIIGDLTAQLALGERTDKVRILSAPRISVLSNQKANIAQTAGILIPETEVSANGVTTTKNSVVQVGVTLDVTPQVSNEGTVTLDLSITRSFLPQVDSKTPDRRVATTKVIVKNGQTAVIGGIFESENRYGSAGVPGLQNIPILGYLFRGESNAKSKNELVIFVTPRILQPIIGDVKKPVGIE